MCACCAPSVLEQEITLGEVRRQNCLSVLNELKFRGLEKSGFRALVMSRSSVRIRQVALRKEASVSGEGEQV